MDVQQINEKMLISLHEVAKESERKRVNLDLRTTPEDTSQRMLNVLEPGTEVPIHRHENTSETIVCLEGCMDVVIYEVSAEKVGGFVEKCRYRLCPREAQYGVQLPKGTWHSVEVYEPSTIFEAKDGRFVPQR